MRHGRARHTLQRSTQHVLLEPLSAGGRPHGAAVDRRDEGGVGKAARTASAREIRYAATDLVVRTGGDGSAIWRACATGWTEAVFLGRDTELVDDGATSAVAKTQANVFRGARVSRFEEQDFCFALPRRSRAFEPIDGREQAGCAHGRCCSESF